MQVGKRPGKLGLRTATTAEAKGLACRSGPRREGLGEDKRPCSDRQQRTDLAGCGGEDGALLAQDESRVV